MRLAARVVGVAGAAAVAWLLFEGGPKDVTLVYDASGVPQARAVEVDVLRNGEILRHSEFRLAATDHGRASHALKLPEGDYLLRGRVEGPAGAGSVPFEKPLEVHEAGTIVVPLGR